MDGFVRGDLWCSIGWCVIISPIDFSHSRSLKKPSLIEFQLEMDLLKFLSVCAIVTFVECCTLCPSRLSLHKKVKLCCPMLETINYDFSVSLQPSCNKYRRLNCRRRPSSAFYVATTRSHAQRNFFSRSPWFLKLWFINHSKAKSY